jgi:enoyl-CoA hydratase/carnithine racemase
VTDGIRLEVAGSTATLWIDREEKRNAMSAAMWTALPGLVAEAVAAPAVRVLVVRGCGAHFCAGADIEELGTALAADGAVPYRTLNAEAERALATAHVPTVAAIDGSCMGGGVQLALACDLRIATSSARFSIPAGRLGITFPAPSLERLTSVVGVATARWLLFTSAVLDGAEACRVGLVQRCVSAERLEPALDELVASIVATSSVTQLAAKEMLAALAAGQEVPESLVATWEQRAAGSGDLREGLDAFVERRAPSFGPRMPGQPR